MRIWTRTAAAGVFASCLFADVIVQQHAAAHAAMGEQRVIVEELHRPIEIDYDEFGVPTVRGETFLDVVFGHGFVQARHRFFQMDGARRMAAGEVSALAGPALLDMDRAARRYRFREVASQIIERLPEEDRLILESFAAGVNAALETMPAQPFEYQLLQITPEPWRAEDTALVVLGMFDMMHMEADIERRVGVMRAALPEELVRFLTPRASRFDALLMPRVLSDGELVNDWQPLPIPGPEVIDLRQRLEGRLPQGLVESSPIVAGSNNWAVAGLRTEDDRAILANDPHLQYMVPGVWYRAVLEWSGGRAAGLSLPGAPGIIIGTTDHIAWGFTNAMGDFQDYIIIEVHPDDPLKYRSPDGYEPFGEIVEEIAVRGRGIERMTLKTTRWGVVVDEDWEGRPLVLKWTALHPEMVNFRILDMMHAESIEEAVEAASSWYGPSQNVMMADRSGRIAWVVSGYLPNRAGLDGLAPASWACGEVGWDGHLSEDDRPIVVDPPSGILFSANSRTVTIEHAERVGGIWTSGTRARRIGELLNNADRLTESDLFEMQHDTQVDVLDWYRRALLEAAERHPPDDELLLRGLDIVRQWNGRADAVERAVMPLSAFRRTLEEHVIGPLVAPCQELDWRFTYRWFMSDEVVLRLIEERPAHLLPLEFDDWDELLLSAWAAAIERIERRGTSTPNGIETPWAETNRLQMTHPLSAVMPFLAQRLNMPDVPQPGHSHAVRVATRQFGASARLVVSPGHWEDAILQTPAGQSGDPNSPHYRDLHEAWLNGEPTPLVPAESRSRVTLVPAE